MPAAATVALPVKDGGPLLAEVLDAVAGQRVDRDVELLVCDSGSHDGSAELAAGRGARVLRIAPEAFGHGRTRDLLVREARGEHVAFLTQDATPAHPGWLQALLDGFGIAPRVALATGPYRARPGAPVPVRRELDAFFAAMGPVPRAFTLADAGAPPRPGPATFHTDANGALLRAAWADVGFRDVAYAEDQRLAVDLLRAGWAKAWVPDAAVVHSHAYGPVERFQRWFDEFRALEEVFGFRADAHPRRLAGEVRACVARDRAAGGRLRESAAYHLTRVAAAALGTRSSALPPALRRRCSLEGRR